MESAVRPEDDCRTHNSFTADRKLLELSTQVYGTFSVVFVEKPLLNNAILVKRQ